MFLNKVHLYREMPDIFKQYLARIISIHKKELLEKGSDPRNTFNVFVRAALYLDSDTYELFLSKISDETLEKILLNSNEYSLHLIMQYAEPVIVLALLKRISSRDLNKIASDSHVIPLLHYAAKCQSAECFKYLLHTLSDEVIGKVFEVENELGETLLHLAARYQNAEGFDALIERASSTQLNNAITNQDINGWNPLHCVVEHQNNDSLYKMIDKCESAYAINEAIAQQSFSQNNPRPEGNPKANEKEFKNWEGKKSRQSHYGATALHLAAQFLDVQGFKTLIFTADKMAIDNALLKTDSKGRTALQIADQYQDEAAFGALIRITSPTVVATAKAYGSSGFYHWRNPHMYDLDTSIIAEVKIAERNVSDNGQIDLMPFLRESCQKLSEKHIGTISEAISPKK
jgi:ankyrin repeat protein